MRLKARRSSANRSGVFSLSPSLFSFSVAVKEAVTAVPRVCIVTHNFFPSSGDPRVFSHEQRAALCIPRARTFSRVPPRDRRRSKPCLGQRFTLPRFLLFMHDVQSSYRDRPHASVFTRVWSKGNEITVCLKFEK